MRRTELYYSLLGLTTYRSLAGSGVWVYAQALLGSLHEKNGEGAQADWGDLVAELRRDGFGTLGEWLSDQLLYCDDPWPRMCAAGKFDAALDRAARRDVEVLSALAGLSCDDLRHDLRDLLPSEAAPAVDALPDWTGEVPFTFQSLEKSYRLHGAGPFARYRAFIWRDGALCPVAEPDIPGQTDLIGYRLQRDQVVDNTRAMLCGRRVNNVLLYGDSGTGKSATVKSLLSLPDAEDLRLIEVEKESVMGIPELIRSLAGARQKFILFIDDLAFDQDDSSYGVLKTILEGGLDPRPANVAIYATSNRRNLVRQTFSDRAGDEVDRDETIQEKTALADRFGLRIPYLGLTKADFLALVDALAAQAGVHQGPEALHAKAVIWDMRHPGRTPRTARQFIASLAV